MQLEKEARVAWKEQGDYGKAERLFKESGKLYDSPLDSVFLALGQMADEQGKEKEAFEYYSGLLKIEPTNSTVRTPRLLLRYGELCEKFGTIQAARNAYTAAVRTSKPSTLPDEVQKECADLLADVAEHSTIEVTRLAVKLAFYSSINDVSAIQKIAESAPGFTPARLYYGLSLSRQGSGYTAQARKVLNNKAIMENARMRNIVEAVTRLQGE